MNEKSAVSPVSSRFLSSLPSTSSSSPGGVGDPTIGGDPTRGSRKVSEDPQGGGGYEPDLTVNH